MSRMASFFCSAPGRFTSPDYVYWFCLARYASIRARLHCHLVNQQPAGRMIAKFSLTGFGRKLGTILSGKCVVHQCPAFRAQFYACLSSPFLILDLHRPLHIGLGLSSAIGAGQLQCYVISICVRPRWRGDLISARSRQMLEL